MLQTQGTQPQYKQAHRPLLTASVRPSGDIAYAARPLPKYLRLAELVPDIVPVSPATIWRWVKAGSFPAPIKLAAHVTAWKLELVLAWLEARELDPV